MNRVTYATIPLLPLIGATVQQAAQLVEVSLSFGRQFSQTRLQKLLEEQHSVWLLAHTAARSCGNNGLALQQETSCVRFFWALL